MVTDGTLLDLRAYRGPQPLQGQTRAESSHSKSLIRTPHAFPTFLKIRLQEPAPQARNACPSLREAKLITGLL